VAFETIRGASGVDFVGTAGVDALFALNESGSITAEGLAGNDAINVANSTGLVGTTTVKGGEGNDVIAFTDAAGANVSRLSNSSVNGGKGDDTITTAGTESTVVRGNENDDNFIIAGNYSNSTINGNVGEDSFTASGAVTLSNSKFLGGDSNDGLMNFTGAAIAAAVQSTINGSKGNDSIQIGTVTTSNGFTIFGGQGNDLITSTNAGADGVVYSGDLGDDQITTGAAKDSVSGGDGIDLIQTGGDKDTIDAGAGADIVLDGTGDDTVALGADNDTYTDAGGDDSITGGTGADTYNINATSGDKNVYIISATDESAATLSGTSQGFDTFSAGFTAAIQSIDITPVGESLLGDAVKSSTTVKTTQAVSTAASADTFAAAGTSVFQLDNVTVTTGFGTATAATVDVTGATEVEMSGTAGVGAGRIAKAGAAATTGFNYYTADGTLIAETLVGVGAAAGTLIATAGQAGDGVAGNGFNSTAAVKNNGKWSAFSKIETSAITASTADSFAELRSQFANGTLDASGNAAGGTTNEIRYDVVTVNGDGGSSAKINGTYVIVNNTNNILDAGDLMFEIAGGAADDINQFGLFSSTESSSAWII
jgi:hypothetical protein